MTLPVENLPIAAELSISKVAMQQQHSNRHFQQHAALMAAL